MGGERESCFVEQKKLSRDELLHIKMGKRYLERYQFWSRKRGESNHLDVNIGNL